MCSVLLWSEERKALQVCAFLESKERERFIVFPLFQVDRYLSFILFWFVWQKSCRHWTGNLCLTLGKMCHSYTLIQTYPCGMAHQFFRSILLFLLPRPENPIISTFSYKMRLFWKQSFVNQKEEEETHARSAHAHRTSHTNHRPKTDYTINPCFEPI